MAEGQSDKNWWERNVEDNVADHYDDQRKLISEHDTLGRARHDVAVGVGKGAYRAGKGLVTGLVDLATVAIKVLQHDPATEQKIWDVTKKVAKESWIGLFGSPEAKADQNRRATDAVMAIGNAVGDKLKKDWNQAEKDGKKTELISSWVTQGIIEIAAFFVGAGEVRAAAGAAKAGKLAKVGEAASVIAKCPIEEAAAARRLLEAEQAAKEALAAEKAAAELAQQAKKKKLGLGLKSTRRDLDYVKWSKERGYQTYGELSGRGTFSEQIEQAMDAADEIHFNMDGVNPNRVSNKLNDYGEPAEGYTNYELYMIKTKYRDKVIWHAADGTVMPKGWMPDGF